ncbi:RING finger nhl-1 [Brachionus plicatilis]|uniref:RING finger nhl-1 n=1 Tax=Brachionus plicatilis TaxID=10195 RepID=A0A3M7PHE4_BRAPC|nr:RING finger nhl-1 [Brachionus plicatilis]
MKQQCQLYMDDLKNPNKPNGLTSSQNRLIFSTNNLNELKSLMQKLGSLSRDPVHDTISQQNTSTVNTNEIHSNRQRATWNKAPASFAIDFSSTNQNNQTSQSSRDIHSDTTPKPITRSKTFVISTDPVETLNEPAKSIDVNALYNVKPQTRAKTPLTFNVMLNEPSSFADIEQTSQSQDFLASTLSNVSNKPRITEYGFRKKAVKIIGKQGKENGEFNWPLDLAINSFNNNILVTDSRNHRIQIFDQEGKFSRCFGAMGTKEGEFNSPAGIYIDTMSNVYVVDRLNHRIQIFDRYCRYLRSISSGQGNQPGQLNNPWGIAVNKISEIFVCDKENDRICVFNPSGKFLRSFGHYGSENGRLDKPCYIHVTNDNKVFVSDCMNHRIQVFDTNGVFLFKFGREGTKSGEFKYPRGVTCDQEGCILVADSGNSRIQVFANDGRFIAEFGAKGIDSGMFQGVEGLCINKNSNVLVCDKDNNRIQIL